MNKSQKLDRLVSEVEDIFARLPDDRDPKIAALRDKVDTAIFETWTAVAGERAQTEATPDDRMKSVNDYMCTHPWLALTAAVVLSVAASVLAGRVIRGSASRGP